MKKTKSPRIKVTMECLECRQNTSRNFGGVARFITSKNKRNNSNVLQLLRHCKFCNKHSTFKEIK